ncbi:UNVERIFIED_CONTAM: hypothetical protein FKN15_041422 [Acipenser sinensis]
MAAVAAEARAAVASTTPPAGDRVGSEPEILQLAEAEPKIEAEAAKELVSQMDPEPIPDHGDVAPECSSLVSAELEGRPDPDPETAGKSHINPSEQQENDTVMVLGGEVETVTPPADHDQGMERTAERESEISGGDPEIASDPVAGNEVSSDDFQAYPEPRVISDPVVEAISNPDPALALAEAEMEAPLSEETVATDDHTVHTEPDETEPIQTDGEAQTVIEPLPENKPVLDGVDTDLEDESAVGQSFGPYGIPVTVFPKREYRDKPYSMQLKTEAFQAETEKGQCEATGDAPEDPAKNPLVSTNQWTSKPPPLFHEGAPYPPPLFIRDTYNQSIPQPPPRKIKRLKRKLYREEPTSIMNAIKLRPRQVLCDKCKNGIVPDKKDVRKSHSDYRGEESSDLDPMEFQ